MTEKKLALAPVELMLMKAVWRLGKATVQEVRDAVAEERKLAYTTVLTMLRTLEEKGFLSHEEESRRYIYQPIISEEKVTGTMLKDLLDRVFDGSRELLLTRLFELGQVDEDELKLLRQKLSQLEPLRTEGSETQYRSPHGRRRQPARPGRPKNE